MKVAQTQYMVHNVLRIPIVYFVFVCDVYSLEMSKSRFNDMASS